jgi:hypothetical protein
MKQKRSGQIQVGAIRRFEKAPAWLRDYLRRPGSTNSPEKVYHESKPVTVFATPASYLADDWNGTDIETVYSFHQSGLLWEARESALPRAAQRRLAQAFSA